MHLLLTDVAEEDRNDSSCSFIDKYLQPMENPYECRINGKPK